MIEGKLADKPVVPLTGAPEAGRLEMVFEDQVVFAAYRRRPGCLVIDYVEAPPALRGTGAAGVFMAALAAKARADGDKILPLCGYAAAWLQRHPESWSAKMPKGWARRATLLAKAGA